MFYEQLGSDEGCVNHLQPKDVPVRHFCTSSGKTRVKAAVASNLEVQRGCNMTLYFVAIKLSDILFLKNVVKKGKVSKIIKTRKEEKHCKQLHHNVFVR